MESGVKLNEHVNVNTAASAYTDIFTPDEGYGLWRDDEAGNLDENSQPMVCYEVYRCQKKVSAQQAPHVWAKRLEA